eukprot:12471155-Ditylum_brightwellii.AAC.1
MKVEEDNEEEEKDDDNDPDIEADYAIILALGDKHSFLDGHVVAMKFNFKDKVGQVLSNEKHRRFFRLKYRIELNLSKDGSGIGGMGNNKRMLVDISPSCNLSI